MTENEERIDKLIARVSRYSGYGVHKDIALAIAHLAKAIYETSRREQDTEDYLSALIPLEIAND